MPPDPPVPVSATFAVQTLFVDFDQDLQPGLLDHGNWAMTWQMFFYTCTLARILPGSPRRVRCTMAKQAGFLEPDTCDYSPPPFDVISVKGVPAAEFHDYPVT